MVLNGVTVESLDVEVVGLMQAFFVCLPNTAGAWTDTFVWNHVIRFCRSLLLDASHSCIKQRLVDDFLSLCFVAVWTDQEKNSWLLNFMPPRCHVETLYKVRNTDVVKIDWSLRSTSSWKWGFLWHADEINLDSQVLRWFCFEF